jgi:PAS domain S-box-containing protein
VDLNQAAADMLGYSMDEMIGNNGWLLAEPNSMDKIMHRITTKSKDAYQTNMLHKDGTVFPVEIKGSDFEVAGEPVRIGLIKEIKE